MPRPGDHAVDDGDVGVQPLARERPTTRAAAHDEVGGLVAASDRKSALQPPPSEERMRAGLSYSRRVESAGGQEEQMRRKFVVGGLVLALAVSALALAGGSAARSEQEPLQGGFIYPGPHNDGWSQHDVGGSPSRRRSGNKVETTYKENIFSNAGSQVVAGLAREGYDMIFGCSFGMFENGVNGQLYKKYPDVFFEQATGTQVKKNQSEYFGAGEDTIYLSGMAAGAASKKGLIGYIVRSAFPRSCATSTRSRSARR